MTQLYEHIFTKNMKALSQQWLYFNNKTITRGNKYELLNDVLWCS